MRQKASSTTGSAEQSVRDTSQADQVLTRRLKDALALIDVRVLDHIVVGGVETVSFAERGLI